MKVRLFFIVCFIAVYAVCFAQNTVIPSDRTILAEMKMYDPAIYGQYRSAKKMQMTGIIMSSVGGGFVVIGSLFSIFPDADRGQVTMRPIVIQTNGDHRGWRKAGNIILATGATSLSAGLPMMIVAGKKKKQTFQDYKYQYYSQQPSSYFQMSVYPNKIGIAYVF